MRYKQEGQKIMTTFDGREKAAEQKYKMDQETEFKITARRNKLLGLWVAKQLGWNSKKSEEYATAVVMADFQKPGDDDVIEKVMADCKQYKLSMSESALRKQMQDLRQLAKQQVLDDKEAGKF